MEDGLSSSLPEGHGKNACLEAKTYPARFSKLTKNSHVDLKTFSDNIQAHDVTTKSLQLHSATINFLCVYEHIASACTSTTASNWFDPKTRFLSAREKR